MALNLDALNSIMGRPNGGAQNLGGVPVSMEDLVTLKSATTPGQGQVQALGNILQTMTAPQSRAQAAGIQMGGSSLPMFSARPEDPAGFTRLEPQDAYKKIFEALQSGQLTSPVTPPTGQTPAASTPAADQVRPPQQDTTRGNPYAAFRSSVSDVLKRVAGLNVDDDYFRALFPQGGPQEFVNRFAEVFGPALSKNFTGLSTIRNAGRELRQRTSR